MSITDSLKNNRPNLSQSSLKTYSSVLRNLQKNMNGDGIEWFSNNDKDILDYLKEKTAQTKKTTLSALFVLTKKQSYKDVMMTVMKSVNDKNKEQQMNSKQEENWMSVKEIQDIYEPLLVKAKLMLSKKSILNESTMMEFLLVSFLGGVVKDLPPRRSQDYTELKIRNYDTKKDNYYKASKFYFNVYKTAKTYGLQILDVPKELDILLKKWIKINTNDYMLYSTNGKKLSSPQVTRILNKVFDKNVSTSMLRHIYLTNKYKDIPALSKMQDLATEMSHSVSQAMEYIKR
jgi:site-specific recombinase XerD